MTNTEPIFFGASDASFADDPSTRASSDGYLFKLFGMPIDWKATKQRSITKSTTEAELYALSVLPQNSFGGTTSSFSLISRQASPQSSIATKIRQLGL
jgi:hypothetical protein